MTPPCQKIGSKIIYQRKSSSLSLSCARPLLRKISIDGMVLVRCLIQEPPKHLHAHSGLGNLTHIGGFPLYLSKPHYLESDPYVQVNTYLDN